MDPHNNLSRRERQVMDIVWSLGRATALDVQKRMRDKLAGSSIRTFLRSLEEKGYVRHEKDGAEYVYLATRARSSAGKSALERVLSTFFDGSIDKALAAYLADAKHSRNMDPKEYERLRDYIRNARSDAADDAEKQGDSR